MQKNKRDIPALFAVLLSCLLVFQMALPAAAQTDYRTAAGLFRAVVGEEDAVASAVVGAVGEDLYCFTIPITASEAQALDEAMASLVIWEKWHTVEYYGGTDQVGMWTLSGIGSETQQPLQFILAEQGTVCTLVYATSLTECATIGGITLETVLDADNGLIAIDGVTSQQVNYPAALINSFGQIVAVALSQDTAFAFVDEETYGSSGGVSQNPPEEENPGSGSAGGGSDGESAGSPEESERPGSMPSGSSSGGSDGGFESIGAGLALLAVSAAGIALVVLRLKKKKGAAPQPVPESPPAFVPGPTLPQPEKEPEWVPPTEPVPSGRLCLVATGGYMMGRVYPMESEEVTIGRSPTAGIPYKAESVSKLHCKLYRDAGGRWMLMDCNSRNGTYLQRMGRLTPMQPVEVHGGDVFYLGSPKYSFEIRG